MTAHTDLVILRQLSDEEIEAIIRKHAEEYMTDARIVEQIKETAHDMTSKAKRPSMAMEAIIMSAIECPDGFKPTKKDLAIMYDLVDTACIPEVRNMDDEDLL